MNENRNSSITHVVPCREAFETDILLKVSHSQLPHDVLGYVDAQHEGHDVTPAQDRHQYVQKSPKGFPDPANREENVLISVL